MRSIILRLAPLLLLLAIAACGGKRAAGRTPRDVTPLRTLPADSVYVLEAGGTPPSDTVVRFAPGRRRASCCGTGRPTRPPSPSWNSATAPSR
jgi:hypothetical protein